MGAHGEDHTGHSLNAPILDIPWDVEAVLIERPNRFVAIVDIPERELTNEKIHVHDPGRLKELLYPGNRLLIKREDKATRKTKWDLIAARWEDQWILLHSGYHRYIAEAILSDPSLCPFGPLEDIRSEVNVGRSRMDFLVTGKDGVRTLVEVKGCSLTIDEIALFPDAPTERGTRHLQTLTRELGNGMGNGKEGMRAGVIILILRSDSTCFRPNEPMDPKFAEAFRIARQAGVQVHPLLLSYENGTIQYHGSIPVCFH